MANTYSQTMRHLYLSALLVTTCFSTYTTRVYADDRSVYVAPGPRTIISPANLSEASGSARKLGDLIGGSLKLGEMHATDVLVTTKCGRYLTALITYADGTVKSLSLSNAPATKSDMEKAKAAIPILRVEDLAGCSG